jgi:hypothetical protein
VSFVVPAATAYTVDAVEEGEHGIILYINYQILILIKIEILFTLNKMRVNNISIFMRVNIL